MRFCRGEFKPRIPKMIKPAPQGDEAARSAASAVRRFQQASDATLTDARIDATVYVDIRTVDEVGQRTAQERDNIGNV